jgi:phospholipid/cholesterol/gamma-HCH transport system substrate-binding protein
MTRVRAGVRSVGELPSGIALGVAALLVVCSAGVATALGGSGATTTVVAHFTRAVAVYDQATVRVLGVPVGRVTKVKAEGTTVAVTMQITKRGLKIPANAQAFIIPPALVSDRYIQLVPAYTSGPALSDGADIPVERTHAPVEKDQIVASLDRLDNALGPEGANRDGALSQLVHVGAQNFADGRAEQIRQTVSDLANLVSSLDVSKDSLAGAVTQLDRFTQLLLRDDSSIRTLYTDLATVSSQLAGDRKALAAALKNLSLATGEIASLVKHSRGDLKADLAGLVDLTNVLVQNKDAVIEVLDVVPLALQNLAGSFNPASNNLETRSNEGELFGSQQSVTSCNVLTLLGLPCQSAPASAGSAVTPSPRGTTSAGPGVTSGNTTAAPVTRFVGRRAL